MFDRRLSTASNQHRVLPADGFRDHGMTSKLMTIRRFCHHWVRTFWDGVVPAIRIGLVNRRLKMRDLSTA